jgi:hypothetical protein
VYGSATLFFRTALFCVRYYAASSGKFLVTFRDNLSVPSYSSLHNKPEECTFHLLRRGSLKLLMLGEIGRMVVTLLTIKVPLPKLREARRRNLYDEKYFLTETCVPVLLATVLFMFMYVYDYPD